MNKTAINYIIEIIVGSLLFLTWLIMFWLTAFQVGSFDTAFFLTFNEIFLPLIIGYLGHSTLSNKRATKKLKEIENDIKK